MEEAYRNDHKFVLLRCSILLCSLRLLYSCLASCDLDTGKNLPVAGED